MPVRKYEPTTSRTLLWRSVASPEFVARRGKDGNYVMGHSRWTSGLAAAAARNAVLIERAVSCWPLHQLISQTVQHLDSWLSDLLQSKLKMKLLEVEGGARAPVPHSWRRLCWSSADSAITKPTRATYQTHKMEHRSMKTAIHIDEHLWMLIASHSCCANKPTVESEISSSQIQLSVSKINIRHQ